jgi:hypothetical protein
MQLQVMRHTVLSLLATLTAALPTTSLRGQEIAGTEVRTAPETTDATIPDRITDGTPQLPPAPVVKPDFQIESTQVKRVDVVEAPELPELPPVEGRITIRVHTVADPGLPDPPPPLPPLEVDDPQVLARLAELRAKYKETKAVFLSATVYDGKRTLLRCYPSGDVKKEIAAWSNVDFNHFCGFGGLEATGADGEVRKYSLLMGIGSENTNKRAAFLASRGMEYKVPEIPVIPDGEPAFVIQTESPDPESVTLIEDLHALYRIEGARMAEACAAREKAREERKAYLLANPEKPKDVKVHFWKRDKSAANTQAKGEQP